MASGLKMQCHRNEVINLCLLRQQMQLHLAKSLFFVVVVVVDKKWVVVIAVVYIY